MGTNRVIVSKQSETYRLLAAEATEHFNMCIQDGMSLTEIKALYIDDYGHHSLSYGNVLNALIREHLASYRRLAEKKTLQMEY